MTSETEKPAAPSAGCLIICVLLFLASAAWYKFAASSPGAYQRGSVTTSTGPMHGWTTTTYTTQTSPFIGVELPTIAVAGSTLLLFVAWLSYRSDKKAFVTTDKNPKADVSVPASPQASSPTTAPPSEPVQQACVSTSAATDPSLKELPNPIDGNQLAALESAVEDAIAQLAENPRLMTILTDAPWGWPPAEIRTQSSAADARRLMLTKIGTLLGRRQKRIMDASFRMRFAHGDTSWDRDFGKPTSVLRVEFHVPGDERDGRKNWKPGVTAGKVASTRFLVWEWGE
jgi:hypothetical protein